MSDTAHTFPSARVPTFGVHGWMMAALAIAAVAVGWSLLPGENERIAALERDGQWIRALGLLEVRFKGGDRSQRTLYLMQKIYEQQGNRDGARRVLELLAEARPRDATVQRQLAQLYKQTQDEPAYVRALGRQLELRYAEPVCRELIGIHRRNGDYNLEQLMIAACRAQGYRRADDLIRLAFLSAADGKTKEATTLLSAVDDSRWLKTSRERLLLFSNLIDANQAQEAVRRSVRWLRGRPNDDFALELIGLLVAAKRPDLGMQIARDIGSPGDAVALAAGELMIEQVQIDAAKAFLAGWLAVAKPMSIETGQRFVGAALDVDAPLLAVEGATKLGIEHLDQGSLASLGIALAAAGHAAEVDTVRPALLTTTIAAEPLLAGSLAVRDGQLEIARLHLAQVRIEGLDERKLAAFEQLSERAGRPSGVTAVLREVRPARAAIIGPAQARAKTILRKAAVAKQRTRLRRAARPAAGVAGQKTQPKFGGFTPIPIPN